MSEWIEQYGYWAVLLGTIIEGEASYLAGIISSRLTDLNPFVIAACGFIGGMIRDFTIFTLSLRGSKTRWVAKRIDQEKLEKVRNWIERRPFYFLIFHRYAYGFSTAVMIVLGAARYPVHKYILLTVTACFVWVLGYGILGYFFSDLVMGWME